MTDELKQDIANDVEMAKAMTNISSPEAVLELTNRLIGYTDLINESIASLEYQLSQLKGKQKVLTEFIRTSKAHAQSLSINRYQSLKKY